MAPLEYIYYEGDSIDSIFFMRNGSANYILPQYNNEPFCKIIEHTCFGVVDIIGSYFSAKNLDKDGHEPSEQSDDSLAGLQEVD